MINIVIAGVTGATWVKDDNATERSAKVLRVVCEDGTKQDIVLWPAMPKSSYVDKEPQPE